jgi:Cu-processing system permease protein
LSGDVSKAMISLMNIIIILSPLIGTLFGIMYYYNSREFAELLLAQPVKRSSIFLGQYFGLSVSLSLSFLMGVGIPFLIFGIAGSTDIGDFNILLLTGILLTFIFTGFSFVIAVKNENRIKGFGLAILVWLFLAVVYDGLFLLSLIIFQDYPVEKLALTLTILNPIDLSRILIILKMDYSALLGYTGAVFNKFFGTNTGMLISILSLIIWTTIPVVTFNYFIKKKDF